MVYSNEEGSFKNTKKRSYKKATENLDEVKYTKEQFFTSKSYFSKKDLIFALLEDDVNYSKEEVDEIINNYLKGEI